MFSITASVPTCYIAVKDAYFSLRRYKTVTPEDNIKISLLMWAASYILAAVIPNISDAITLTGATVNPFIGFIFPIVFYLKLSPVPMRSPKKLLAVLAITLILFASALSFIQYFAT